MTNLNLILASSYSTPRRIMETAGFSFESVVPTVERAINEDMTPIDFVVESALDNAKSVFKTRPLDIIVGVSSIVTVGGKKMAPPSTDMQARELLRKLSGFTHRVYSAVAILSAERQNHFFSDAKVTMCKLDSDTIERYVNTGEAVNSFSGYYLFGKGASLVETVSGDWYAVAGLPVAKLAKFLSSDYDIEAF